MDLTHYNRKLLSTILKDATIKQSSVIDGKLITVAHWSNSHYSISIPVHEADGLYDYSLLAKTGNAPRIEITDTDNIANTPLEYFNDKRPDNNTYTTKAIPIDLSVVPLLNYGAFTSKNSTRAALKCVCVNNEHIVATDGYRMLMTDNKQASDLGKGILLDLTVLSLLNEVSKNEKYSCNVFSRTTKFSEDNVVTKNEVLTITTNSGIIIEAALLDSEYPNYLEAIPNVDNENKGFKEHIINRNEFLQQLSTAQKEHKINNRTKAYFIERHDNGKVIAATKAEVEKGTYWQGIEVPEFLLDIPRHMSGFNIEYMYTCMKNLPSPEIKAYVSKENAYGAVLLFKAHGTTALLMTLRRLDHDEDESAETISAIRSCHITAVDKITKPTVSTKDKHNAELNALKDTIKQLTNELRAAKVQVEVLQKALDSTVKSVPTTQKRKEKELVKIAPTVSSENDEEPEAISTHGKRMATFKQVGLIRRLTKGTVDYATIKQLTFEQASTAITIAKQANGDAVIGSQSATITTEAIREMKDFINKVLTLAA